MRIIALWLLIGLLLLVGATRNPFGDEADNLLGGKIIASGGALYIDYWTHHAPLPYQVAAVYAAFGAKTYLHFRLMWDLTIWLGGLALYAYLRDGLVLVIWLALALTGPVTGSNMLTAESCVGWLVIAAWLLLMSKRASALPAIVLLCWLIPLASLKAVYLATFLLVATIWRYRKQRTWLAMSLIAPAVLSLIWLEIYRNGAAFIDQAYVFNRDYYSIGYGTPLMMNPVGVLLMIPVSFAQGLIGLQGGYAPPVILTLVFAIELVIERVIRRRWQDASVLLALVVLSYPSGDAQYQPQGHFIGHYMLMVAMAVYAVWSFCQVRRYRLVKLVTVGLLAIALLPGLVWSAEDVSEPPPYAAMVNRLTRPGDSVWYAPGGYTDWLITDAPNSTGRYYVLYPWLWSDPALRADLMARLAANPPDVLVYVRDAHAGGGDGATLTDYAPRLTSWVDAHYRRLSCGVDVYGAISRYEELVRRCA